MTKIVLILTFLLLSCVSKTSEGPFKVYPENPHYMMYMGKPILLVTSDEHYGAVVNTEFDYVAFLNKLSSKGFNFTRIYPGSYIEVENAFLNGNVLGVRNGKQVLPWAKTNVPGASPVQGGYKYDLDKWNEEYFERLRDFCKQASSRGIIVEICFFNGEYNPEWGKGGWPIQAFNSNNNINDAGTCTWDMVMSLTGDPRLVGYQEKYVMEITRRLNDFDNIIFHVCDEPWICNNDPKVFGPWLNRMIDAFLSVERQMPKKHLLGQTVDYYMRDNVADYSGDPRIQYIDIEYVRGINDLEKEYIHNKPIILIETGYYPVFYKKDNKIEDCRVEAWEFMIGGCAGFMNLNGLYSVDNETGEGTEIEMLLENFVKLNSFLKSFSTPVMKRDLSFILSKHSEGTHFSGLSEPGRQYAFYVHHSETDKPANTYIVAPGSYEENYIFNIPPGNYTAQWIDPASGMVKKTGKFNHKGGNLTLKTPIYTIDIALKLKSSAR